MKKSWIVVLCDSADWSMTTKTTRPMTMVAAARLEVERMMREEAEEAVAVEAEANANAQ